MSLPTAQIRSPNAVPNTTGALSAELARRTAINASIAPQQAIAEQLSRDAAQARLANTLAASRQAQKQFQANQPPRPTGGGTSASAQNINSFLSNSQSGRVAPQSVVNNAYTPGANYHPVYATKGNTIAARNAAAAAGGTLAQATAAARAATPATTARGVLQASPILGAGLAGVFAAGSVRASGGSWAEATFSGVGATIGASAGLGIGLGIAVGSLGTGNPVIAVAAPTAGQLGGAAIGGAVGVRAGGVYDLLPMLLKNGLNRGLGALIPGFGALSPLISPLSRWLQPEEVAGPPIDSPENGSYTPGQEEINWPPNAGFFYHQTNGLPISRCGVIVSHEGWGGDRFATGSLTYQQYPGGPLLGDTYLKSDQFWGHGDPRDTSGLGFPWPTNCASPNYSQPAQEESGIDRPLPRYYNPLDNLPPAASPETTPPATAPAPNNDASQAPAIRPSAPPTTAPAAPNPGPALPAGDPLVQPAPVTNPTANPDPNATPNADPTNVPSKLPNPDKKIQPALQPGQTVKLPGGTTITGTETGYKISSPTDSPSTIKLPNGQTLLPGDTGEISEEETAAIPWWAVPFLAVPAGQLIKDPTKPGGFVQTPTQPPAQPLPLPPNNGCRCNGPILAGQATQAADISDLRARLVRVEGNQTGPTGFAGIYAFLAEMRTKLGAIGDFAETAWKATKMQKVLDVLTFVGVMHNVSMLSREVGETFFYLVSQGLDIVGVDDEEGNALDIGSIVGTSVNNYLISVFGEAFVDGARDSYRKANRIVQSASMVIWTIRSIQDSSLDLMEWVAEHTGKIGNALKRFGVVGERAYPWMSEKAQAQHRMRNRFDKVTGTLERAEDVVSSATVATSNVLEIQQETGELAENFGNFRTSVLDAVPDPWLDNASVNTKAENEAAASTSPAINAANAERVN